MKEELIKKLAEIKKNEGAYGLAELKNWTDESGFKITTEYVEGGYEGSGEDHFVVLKVEKDQETTYWKTPGYYYSHDGRYLEVENTHQVEPYERMVQD